MSKKSSGPRLPDPTIAKSAGINPVKGTKAPPERATTGLKSELLKMFRIIDEQDAVNRYTWYNLPAGLSSQELERFLYYRGNLVFFQINGEFYFMPYALDGGLDFYRRYKTVHPVPFNSGSQDGKEDNIYKMQKNVLALKKLSVQYDVIPFDELTEEIIDNGGVILHDYTRQWAENLIPRKEINDPLLEIMSEIIPLTRTSLINGSGTKGMRVDSANDANEVTIANRKIYEAALSGEPYTPITAKIDFQELTEGTITKSQDYLLVLQALDNMRLGTYGIDNGGIFEKKAHKLETEQAMNDSTAAPIYQDGLQIRQRFCDIVNSIWGLGIWVEPSEAIVPSTPFNPALDAKEVVDAGTSDDDLGGNQDGENI